MIIRRKHNINYTVVPNAIYEDLRLSIEAKGGLGYLLSRPPNWVVRHGHLRKLWRVGEDRFQRIVGELIAAGYMERGDEQPRDDDHRFMPYEYVVRDIPSATPCAGFPLRGSRKRKPDNGNKYESINTDPNKNLPQTPSYATANGATADCGSASGTEQADASLVGDVVLSEFGRAAYEHGCSFVYEGSKPFAAWREFRGDDGLPPLDVVVEGGVKRRGIWMASLYPRGGRNAGGVE
jgi:hypothetical protein